MLIVVRNGSDGFVAQNYASNATTSTAVFTPTSAGTYWISVMSASGGGTGTYGFSVSSIVVGPTNDACTSSQSTSPCIVSTSASFSGQMAAAREIDFIRASTSAGQSYSVGLTGAMADDLLIVVRRSATSSGDAGSFVAQNYGSGAIQTSVTFTATESATWLQVYSLSGSRTGAYTLSLVPAAPPTTDCANTRSSTCTIAASGATSGTIDTAGDLDYLALTVTSGRAYTIERTGGTLSSANTLIVVRNSSDGFIAQNYAAGVTSSTMSFTPTSSGTFWVVVSSISSSATGTYTLSVSSTAPVTDDCASTTSTSCGMSVGGANTGSLERSGDIDYYALSVTAGQAYTVSRSGGTLAFTDVTVTIRNSTGSLIIQNTGSSSFTAASSGTSYVVISANTSSANRIGTYTISITTSSTDNCADNTSSSCIMPGSGDTSGSLEIAGDADYFLLSMTTGQTFTIARNGGSLASSSVRITVRNDTTIFTQNTGSVSFTASASGNIWVVITAADGTSTGSYSVNVSSTTPPVNDAIPGSTSSNTFIFPSTSAGGSTSQSSTIDTLADSDWFRTILTGGVSYQIEIRGLPSSNGTLPDSFLRLRDSSGNLIASDDDSGTGTDSLLTFTPSSSATYFIDVQSYGNSYSGTYAIYITTLGSGTQPPSQQPPPTPTGGT